ncbi:hypothetical protein CRU90_03855 [Arcobacter cloacae]|uniref:SH3 domain-containing protein n=2 Tax=Arcobacter cloacae TaxID=1054034 RepID=A0A4Q0ZJ23_9BACT|nr:hypothetical protein CRU90_03855 [Arcobacter cloacae]
MNLYLNKIKREDMKKISLILLGIFTTFNLYAQEQVFQEMKNMDKLDVLDRQSKDFFNAITGLEKDYLEEQVNAIKNKKVENPSNPNQPQAIVPQEPTLSQEDYEKNVFTHQNEMARLTTDFTRTKKLKDLKIKSMYSFNGKDYAVLELIDETSTRTNGVKTELSANIEGRYIEGDNILGHKIIDINTRTKSIELYKKLDEEYGYTIYLSNYGISVSDLKKIEKVNDKTEAKKEEPKVVPPSQNKVKDVFNQVTEKEVKKEEIKTDISNCLYTVRKQNLNVRNKPSLEGRILRVLKINDQFIINKKENDWVQIDTIYKKISGDVMVVSKESNWVQIVDGSVSSQNDECK